MLIDLCVVCVCMCVDWYGPSAPERQGRQIHTPLCHDDKHGWSGPDLLWPVPDGDQQDAQEREMKLVYCTVQHNDWQTSSLRLP